MGQAIYLEYLLATNNPNKVVEIQKIFDTHQLKITSLAALGLFFEAQEPWDTFEKNAMEKAQRTQEFLNQHGHHHLAVIADDSGLAIDALEGLPGVDSANYMGRQTPYAKRNAHLVQLVDQKAPHHPNGRLARFVSVMACVFPPGAGQPPLITRGEVEGHIATAPQGEGGFGYDPIFYLPAFGKTMAQLSLEEKNTISHRGQALSKLLASLIHYKN